MQQDVQVRIQQLARFVGRGGRHPIGKCCSRMPALVSYHIEMVVLIVCSISLGDANGNIVHFFEVLTFYLGSLIGLGMTT